MGRKLGLLLWAALLLIGVAGCSGGSYVITVGTIDSTDNSLTGNYNSFSGYYFKKVKLEEGKTLQASFTAQTVKGELTAKVIDADGKAVKTLENGKTVSINQPGKYKLQVEGKKHKGSFALSWDIK